MYAIDTHISTATAVMDYPPPAKRAATRGVGKAKWKKVLMLLIESEQEDLDDLAILRRKLHNDPEAQRIIAEMCDRKTARIIQICQLMNYKNTTDEGLVAGG